MERKKKVLVMGVIGADVHAVGNRILYQAFTEAGFDVINLGVMVSQEEYIAAAIMPRRRRLYTWSFISAMSGVMTIHTPSAARAGT